MKHFYCSSQFSSSFMLYILIQRLNSGKNGKFSLVRSTQTSMSELYRRNSVLSLWEEREKCEPLQFYRNASRFFAKTQGFSGCSQCDRAHLRLYNLDIEDSWSLFTVYQLNQYQLKLKHIDDIDSRSFLLFQDIL